MSQGGRESEKCHVLFEWRQKQSVTSFMNVSVMKRLYLLGDFVRCRSILQVETSWLCSEELQYLKCDLRMIKNKFHDSVLLYSKQGTSNMILLL